MSNIKSEVKTPSSFFSNIYTTKPENKSSLKFEYNSFFNQSEKKGNLINNQDTSFFNNVEPNTTRSKKYDSFFKNKGSSFFNKKKEENKKDEMVIKVDYFVNLTALQYGFIPCHLDGLEYLKDPNHTQFIRHKWFKI